MECLEAAITPETKVGEREIAELTCLMSLNNFILAHCIGCMCQAVRAAGVASVETGWGTAGSNTSPLQAT